MKYCKIGLLILLILSAVLAITIPNIRESFVIKETDESGKSSYILWPHHCLTMLELSENDKKIFSIRDITGSPSIRGLTYSCSYERRMQLTEKILARIAKDTNNLKRLKYYSPEELGTEPMYRLASAAAKSPEWDRKRGCPKGNGAKIGTNGLVKKYIQENNVFKELSDIFGKYHLKLEVRDVEMVLVPQVDKSSIAEYAKRPDSPISPEDKLPMGGIILFEVEPH
jgi:hypothetical protein